jgi:hypothetical protein
MTEVPTDSGDKGPRPAAKSGISGRAVVIWSAVVVLVLSACVACTLVYLSVRETEAVLAETRFVRYTSGGPASGYVTVWPQDAVRKLGGPERAIGRLSLYLKAPWRDAQHRWRAANLLSWCGPRAADGLLGATRDPDPTIRITGLYGLMKIRPLPQGAEAAAERLAADPDGDVRRQAAKILRAMREKPDEGEYEKGYRW